MNLEHWKTYMGNRMHTSLEEDYYRDMFSYHVGKCQLYCYPTELVDELQAAFPSLAFQEVYYSINRFKEARKAKDMESCYMHVLLEGTHYTFSVHLDHELEEWSFSYSHFQPTEKEITQFFSFFRTCFLKVQELMVEKSPKRLQVISSSYYTLAPPTILTMLDLEDTH